MIKYPSTPGLFEEANERFKKDPKFRNNTEVTDEIWFFFDIERKDIEKWDQRFKIIKHLRRLRKNPNIKVRLLMTTGCMEYWLMLHYRMFAPPLLTVADKMKMLKEVVAKEPTYVKGDYNATSRIAEQYPNAIIHAKKTVQNLLQDGLPGIEDTDERNKWRHTYCKTFSTVYEAIVYLEKLNGNDREN